MKKTILTAAALIALSTTAQAETFKSYEECVMARGESWVQVRIEWGGCDIIAKAGTPLPKAQPKVEVAKEQPKAKVYVPKDNNSFQTASNFTIKGLKMGMEPAEIAKVTGKDFGNGKIGSFSHTLKNYESTACGQAIPKEFSIGGLTGWRANCRHKGYDILGAKDSNSTENGMYSLSKSFHSDQFDDVISIFSAQYGTPKITTKASKNILKGVFGNRTARWNINGVTIKVYEHLNKVNEGYISISSDAYWSEWHSAKKGQTQSAKKDF